MKFIKIYILVFALLPQIVLASSNWQVIDTTGTEEPSDPAYICLVMPKNHKGVKPILQRTTKGSSRFYSVKLFFSHSISFSESKGSANQRGQSESIKGVRVIDFNPIKGVIKGVRVIDFIVLLIYT